MAKYKNKKSSGCAMCKPWKHGWEPKHKPKDRARLKEMVEGLGRSKNPEKTRKTQGKDADYIFS